MAQDAAALLDSSPPTLDQHTMGEAAPALAELVQTLVRSKPGSVLTASEVLQLVRWGVASLREGAADQPNLQTIFDQFSASLDHAYNRGFFDPQQGLLSWLDIFITQQAGWDVYKGLFTSCRQGREWVLWNAEKARLTIDTTDELTPAEWARRLQAVRQALQTRGARRTRLWVVLTDTPSSIAACLQLLGALKGVAQGIWGVVVEITPTFAPGDPSHLNGSLQAFLSQLPGPAELPKLKEIYIRLSSNHAAEHTPHALSTTLTLLQHLRTASDVQVEFGGWGWTYETAQALATALAALPHLRVSVSDYSLALTDERLAVLSRLGPHLRRLVVASLQLESDHSHEPWPWPGAELHSHYLRLSEAVKLPRINSQTPGSVDCHRLTLDEKVAKEVSAGRAAAWLQTAFKPRLIAEVAILQEQHLRERLTDQQYAQQLRDKVNVLSAAPWESIMMQLSQMVSIDLISWPMAHHTMQELQCLPSFTGTLHFFDCADVSMWPLEPHEYQQLATHIPTTFTMWCFHESTFPPDSPLLQCICAGVNARRKRLGLPRLLLWSSPGAHQDVHVGEHVTLTSEWHS